MAVCQQVLSVGVDIVIGSPSQGRCAKQVICPLASRIYLVFSFLASLSSQTNATTIGHWC